MWSPGPGRVTVWRHSLPAVTDGDWTVAAMEDVEDVHEDDEDEDDGDGGDDDDDDLHESPLGPQCQPLLQY